MEIQELVKATTIIPVADLTTIAATRAAFGDDVLTAYKTQIELRTTEAQKVLDAATAANRDTLLASEQRSYDGHVRDRDAILSLQLAIEKRTDAKAFVPPSQHGAGGNAPAKRGGLLFGLELRDLKESATPGSIIAPDEWSSSFFDKLAAESVALRSGMRVIRTMRDAVHVPHINADPAANWTAEGAPITPTDPGYDDVIGTPRKLAGITVVSNELIADSNPDVVSLLEMQLTRALALKLDLGIFEGSGTAPEIKGMKNQTGITTDSSLAAAPANLDVFAKAIATLESFNARATAIVMSPRTWGSLLLLKQGTANNNMPLLTMTDVAGAVRYSLFGVPVYLSSQLSITEGAGAESSAYVYEAAQSVVVVRQDTTVAVDRSRLFNSDQSEIRAILRADYVLPNPKSVVRISKFV